MELLLLLGLLAVCALAVLLSNRKQDGSPRNTASGQTHPRKDRTRPAQSREAETSASSLNGSAYVVDGDTIVIRKTNIRLFGIDAPELNHPYGVKAKWALVSLCKGRNVRAEVTDKDTHGRTVARCFLDDGRDLSAEMVKLGLAIDWPKFSSGCYASLEVRDVRRKLWLADARQKGRMHVWEQYEVKKSAKAPAR